VTRQGQPNAVLLEDWSEVSGMKLWNLGVDVADLAVVDAGTPELRFTLTDPAAVTIEVSDPASGRVLATRATVDLAAGAHQLALTPAELAAANAGAGGERVVRVGAASRYTGGPSASAETRFTVAGGNVLPPGRPMLLGNVPNPAFASTRISYLLPQSPAGAVTLRLYDSRGRRVRSLTPGLAPGLNEVMWDGRDDSGARVAPGVYFYRLGVGAESLGRRLVWGR
jgi:hypothetical protein